MRVCLCARRRGGGGGGSSGNDAHRCALRWLRKETKEKLHFGRNYTLGVRDDAHPLHAQILGASDVVFRMNLISC